MPDDQIPQVFFISPIGEVETETRQKADQTLRHLVRKALELEPLNCEVERADEDTDPGSITPRMLNSIMTADLLVIDLTNQNPNVFYEMAIAHGYHRPCVHIITEGQRVPFDVKDINTVPYLLSDPDKLEAAVTKLRSYAKTALQNGTTTTPLSAAERFSVVQSSTDPTVEALAEISSRLDQLALAVRSSDSLPVHVFKQVVESLVGRAESAEADLRTERSTNWALRSQIEHDLDLAAKSEPLLPGSDLGRFAEEAARIGTQPPAGG